MTAWSIRFHGSDEREVLARADTFFLINKETLGLSREEFFARLVLNEAGTEGAFIESGRQPLWQVPQREAQPVGTEPAVGTGLEAEEVGLEVERPASGPESAAAEDAL